MMIHIWIKMSLCAIPCMHVQPVSKYMEWYRLDSWLCTMYFASSDEVTSAQVTVRGLEASNCHACQYTYVYVYNIIYRMHWIKSSINCGWPVLFQTVSKGMDQLNPRFPLYVTDLILALSFHHWFIIPYIGGSGIYTHEHKSYIYIYIYNYTCAGGLTYILYSINCWQWIDKVIMHWHRKLSCSGSHSKIYFQPDSWLWFCLGYCLQEQ